MNRDDAKSVAIVALGCFHPVVKVQSASLHFFLGSEEEENDSDDEDPDHVCCRLNTSPIAVHPFLQIPDIRSLEHKRNVTKKTRSGDNKLRRNIKAAAKVLVVCVRSLDIFSHLL